MGRKPCCEKVGLRKGKWTTEEDEILIKYIQVHGIGSWRSLPKNAGLLRCGKSCRLRWINYLRDDLKRGNITPQEEDLILQLHASLGNKWSAIASHLPGRTDNEIKNYWNTHLFRRANNSFFTPTNQTVDSTSLSPIKKRRLGRVSRALAKKYNNTHTRNPFNVRNPSQQVTRNPAQEQSSATTVHDNPLNLPVNFGSFQIDDQTNGMQGAGGSASSGAPFSNPNEDTENGVLTSFDSISCYEMGMPFACFSPINACFDNYEWDYQDPAICDEGEYAIIWPWESN